MARKVFPLEMVFTVMFSGSGSVYCVIIRIMPAKTARIQGCVMTFLNSAFLEGAVVK